MSDAKYENASFCCKLKSVTTKIKAEGKTELNTESVGKIISVSALPFITNKKVEKGVIEFGGKVVFYVGYKDLEGEIKKTECAVDINGRTECEKADENSLVYLSCAVEKAECDLGGITLGVSANLSVKADVSEYGEYSYFSEKDGLFTDKKETEIVRRLKSKAGVYPVEEEFELNYAIKEVLSQKAKAVVTAVQCGMGTIIVDGEVFLSALLLQSGDKKGIIRENKTLPFRAELDYEEAVPAMEAVARVTERSFKTDISVSDEDGKSTVTASVILGLEGEAFSREKILLTQDAFSETEEIGLDYSALSFDEPKPLRTFTERISSTLQKDDIKGSVVAVSGEGVEIIGVNLIKGAVKTEGIFSLLCICYSEGEISSFKVSVPFENVLENLPENCAYDIFATVKEPMAKFISDKEMVLEADIIYTAYPTETKTLKYVKDIKDLGEKEVCDSAISVFIAAENEGLFPLAKRLNVSPEELVAVNPDLSFPLSGKERIAVYRRKK